MSKCYASAVLAIAAAEIGYHEKKSNSQLDNPTANAGSANYTKYARDFDESTRSGTTARKTASHGAICSSTGVC